MDESKLYDMGLASAVRLSPDTIKIETKSWVIVVVENDSVLASRKVPITEGKGRDDQ